MTLGYTYRRAGKSAEAAKLVLELLADTRKGLPEGSPQLAGLLASNGLELLQLKAHAEAEPLLRECLAIREKIQPEVWSTFNARARLGAALLGQKKYAEAEPLLIAGYEGMKQREATIPREGKARLPEALECLIQLCEENDRPGEADKWRKELESRKGKKADSGK